MTKRLPPVQRNDDITLTIHGLGSEGQGIGKYEGFTVFVPFALPGETVRAHIIKVSSGFAVGKLLSVEEKSPNRIAPVCAEFGRCGGCSVMHLAYVEQLQFKRDEVYAALTRIGGFSDPKVLPALGMDDPKSYRNKGSFPFAADAAGKVAFGFFAPRSHRLIPLTDCAIQRDETLLCAKAVADWANRCGVSAYDEKTGRGVLRHVMARVSNENGAVMAVVVTTGKLPHREELVAILRERVSGLCGIIHNKNREDTNVIFGKEFSTVWGNDRLPCTIAGLRFDVSAPSFLQVNPKQTEVLYQAALNALSLKGTERVADVYCGIGTISLMLAKHAASVDGIEIVPEAIEDAKQNAAKNGITNARFHCAPAEIALPKLVKDGFRPDAVVIDPPRKGCERPVLDALIACGAQKLVYVSCNPATLARDAKILAEGGYSLVYAQPVDMFPQTSHVETVALFIREELNCKQKAFFKNAALLSDIFGIVPLMYGSLGLEYLSGECLNADDIDILIPKAFLQERWNEFHDLLAQNGYTLIDAHEHTFEKQGIHYSYAQIEELESFAGIGIHEIETVQRCGCTFKLLSLPQYLKVYTASSKDGYRVNVKEKKDAEKIALIRQLLQEDNG